MSDVKYSKEHEWIILEGDEATIGITKHATEMLGDIVFAELPEKGSNVEKDGTAGVVESTKIFDEKDNEIGKVTSGTFGPSVNASIAMGYISNSHSKTDTKVYLEVRGKKVPANVCDLPFYKKSYVKGANK